MSANNQSQPTSNGQAVQPLHHPGQHALVPKTNLPAHAQGHSEMGGKALLAKKMAASGKSFYSPTDTMVSPCTAKLHLAKKKHHTKGKPVALSSSFNNNSSTTANPLKKTSGLTSAGFLHPSHAASARFHLTNESDFEAETRSQDEEAKKAAPVQEADDDDEEMEM